MVSMQEYDAIVERVVRDVLTRLGQERQQSAEAGGSLGECAVCVYCGKCVEKVPEAVEKIKNAGATRISSSLGVASVDSGIAPLIDHTLLKPDASQADIDKLFE